MPSSAASSFLFPPLLPLLMASFFFHHRIFGALSLYIYRCVVVSSVTGSGPLSSQLHLPLFWKPLSLFFFLAYLRVLEPYLYMSAHLHLCCDSSFFFFKKNLFYLFETSNGAAMLW